MSLWLRQPLDPVQEFGWLALARSKGVDYNEAQLRKQKWSAATRVVKKAMRHRRAAVQARDSSACGDCTQALLRMMPGQGMAPDGSAGETLCRLIDRFPASSMRHHAMGAISVML